jgi:(2Fe-2S) ferredoxin
MTLKATKTPHPLHLFFCTHTRENGEKSCGDTPDTQILADRLKQRFKDSKTPIRITRTGCLGPCAQGPNIMAYPQEVWFQDMHVEDLDALEIEVKRIFAKPRSGSTAS